MKLTSPHSWFAAVAVLVAAGTCRAAAEPAQAYAQFLADAAAGRTSVLPDYSWAGYKFGAAAVPDVTGRVFDVTDYGARPNDDVEDRDQIQAAIHAAEAAGGGIVFFPPGRYLVNEQPDRGEGILIRKPGVILRGSGAGPGGTELFMRHYLLPRNPEQKWTVPAMFEFSDPAFRHATLTTVTADAPKGTTTIEVASARTLKVGDMIRLSMRNPAANPAYLGGLKPWALWRDTNEKGVRIGELHQVAAIAGRIVTLGEPLRTQVSAHDGWRVESAPCADGWAVEDLCFRGNFHEKIVHHKNFIHDAGWSFLSVQQARHAWARRIRLTDVNVGITFKDCFASSMLELRFDGNAGHSTVAAVGGYGVLMGLIDDATNDGAWHGPCSAEFQAGAVIWRYQGQPRSGPDFHASWPYCTLYDASRSGLIGNGGAVNLLPNHLQDLTYWNTEEVGPPHAHYDFWDAPPAGRKVEYTGVKIVRPNLIGFHGSGSTFVREHVGLYESPGQPVSPESLYEAQLQHRLGARPAWIDATRAEWARLSSRFPPFSPFP